MSERYTVKLTRAATKEVGSYDGKIRRQIDGRLEELRVNPRPHDARPLRGRVRGYRIDVGEYRILYDVDYESDLVIVWRVGHRKDVYRNL